MKKVFLSALIGAAILSSCSTSQESVSMAGEWNIVSVEGEEVTSDELPFMGLDIKESRIYGNAGCNNFMGSLSLDSVKGTIKFSQVGATRKMCRDMKLEGQVLAALDKVAGYKATETGAALIDADGKVLFDLKKKVTPVVSVEDLDGEWFITTVAGKEITKVEETPFISFDITEKRVHGTGGCNIFNGTFTQEKDDDASLRFGKMMTTMKAGPGMDQESFILPAFEKVCSFTVKNDSVIELLSENKKALIVLKKNTGKSLAE